VSQNVISHFKHLIGILACVLLRLYDFNDHLQDRITHQEIGGGIFFFAHIEVSIVSGLHEMPDDRQRFIAIHYSSENLFVRILFLIESGLFIVVAQTLIFTYALEVGRKLKQKRVGDFAHLFC